MVNIRAKVTTMQNSKRKTPDSLRFLSSYSLEECRSQLERKTQPMEAGFCKDRTRIQVQTWLDDADSARFRINLMPRGTLQIQISHPAVNITGKLFRQADGTTAVEFDIRNSALLFVGYYAGIFVIFLFIVGFFTWFHAQGYSELLEFACSYVVG